ncbi:hypothetical protein HK100_012148 [Physocladia obscura]|uniref:Cytochrome b561 domain-containing protein n=1 Tax=Physocladia obscura TaxID=109957 RepID=A0AAD5XM00_9FUNG|nr:hypothetical protein HK100_012148 [Physocladia obscura]
MRGKGKRRRATTPTTTTTTISGWSQAINSTATTAVAQFCMDTTWQLCVLCVRDSSLGLARFTVASTARGWIGVGSGSAMAGARMVVAWRNDTDSNAAADYYGALRVVLSPRLGVGEMLPPYAPDAVPGFAREPTPPELLAALPADAPPPLVFSFSVPANNSLFLTTLASSVFIYALADAPPAVPSAVASAFAQHNLDGGFSLDVSRLGHDYASTATSLHIDLVLLHAGLMFVAWSIIPAFAIFIARYLKVHLANNSWFVLHLAFFLGGVSLFAIGGLVAVEMHLVAGSPRFSSSSHAIIGALLVFGLYPLQLIFGFLANALFVPTRSTAPIWPDRVHWWLGRAMMVLVLVQMQLGLQLINASQSVVALFWSWNVFIVFAMYGYLGEFWLGGQSGHGVIQSPEFEYDSAFELAETRQHLQRQRRRRQRQQEQRRQINDTTDSGGGNGDDGGVEDDDDDETLRDQPGADYATQGVIITGVEQQQNEQQQHEQQQEHQQEHQQRQQRRRWIPENSLFLT